MQSWAHWHYGNEIHTMKRKKAARIFCTIDATAFAAILLVLLFEVWLFRTFQKSSLHTDVDAPCVSGGAILRGFEREDAIIIYIRRDGKLVFDSNFVSTEQLPRLLEKHLNRGAERRAYIKADARVKYGTVLPVLDFVRSAGIENISFITLPKTSEQHDPVSW